VLGVFKRHWRPIVLLVSGGLIAALLIVASGATAAHPPATAAHPPAAAAHHAHPPRPGGATRAALSVTPGTRPNIVYVLTDDLSQDLVRYMPQVQALAQRGLTFNNFFTSDSLCCPARSSIFTGNYPHDTGVFTNVGSDGGITAFYNRNNEQNSFNVYLQQAGYRTAMMGKYLNGYLQGPRRSPVPSTYVPPGWNQWDVGGYAYSEYDYQLNQNGRLRSYGDRPRDYLTDVLARKGTQFIDRASASAKPFFLELATFAPHSPYTPAPRDRHTFRGLKAPHPPSFDVLPTDPPKWLAGHGPLTRGDLVRVNRAFRRRVQAVQSVDDMLTKLETALRAHGELRNTYIVFSSDNGLHTGEYRLLPGKLTAFDTDIHVPLVIAGPGIPGGATTDAMSENIDMAKTFEQIAGTSAPCDGHSLVPLFGGGTPPDWRNAVLVEHHGPDLDARQDPDAQNVDSGNPTSYEAMRTPGFLYVEYRDGEREFYDLRTDPSELHNVAGDLTADQVARLHDKLVAMENCHTGATCWAAGHVADDHSIGALPRSYGSGRRVKPK
jgi:arylsulfatase A-like enzyme